MHLYDVNAGGPMLYSVKSTDNLVVPNETSELLGLQDKSQDEALDCLDFGLPLRKPMVLPGPLAAGRYGGIIHGLSIEGTVLPLAADPNRTATRSPLSRQPKRR